MVSRTAMLLYNYIGDGEENSYISKIPYEQNIRHGIIVVSLIKSHEETISSNRDCADLDHPDNA